MKRSKLTTILLVILILLGLFICLTPSKNDLYASTGLWGTKIICNRLRDFVAFPLLCGVSAMLLLSLSSPFQGKLCLPSKPRPFWLVLCVLAIAVGIYASVGVVLLNTMPPLPTPIWHYLMKHSYVLCLWWAVTGILFLLSFYRTKETAAP